MYFFAARRAIYLRKKPFWNISSIRNVKLLENKKNTSDRRKKNKFYFISGYKILNYCNSQGKLFVQKELEDLAKAELESKTKRFIVQESTPVRRNVGDDDEGSKRMHTL